VPAALRLRLGTQFLAQHAEQFNRLQRMAFAPSPASTDGPVASAPLVSRYEPPLSSFFVAALPRAFVEGAGGTVYDADARLYAPPGTFPASWADRWPAGPSARLAAAPAEAHALLGTLIQPFGWMYYHFVVETLPKLVLLRDALPSAASLPRLTDAGDAWNASGARLLLWGAPWEAAWLQLLGVPRSAAVAYDPARRYAAELLLLPSPVPSVTPPAEALLAARGAVCAVVGCAVLRDAIVYTSRAGERSRAVANEAALLDALRVAFPALQLLVHTRDVPPAAAVAMFARAAAVVGPHGAGLSHALFCQPGTALVELVFMHSPPMMFWHIAAALQLRYAMAPLPHSFWRVLACVCCFADVDASRAVQGTACQGGGRRRGGRAAAPHACCVRRRVRSGLVCCARARGRL
jgi:capsular polysaccharide biosynthesis protein